MKLWSRREQVRKSQESYICPSDLGSSLVLPRLPASIRQLRTACSPLLSRGYRATMSFEAGGNSAPGNPQDVSNSSRLKG